MLNLPLIYFIFDGYNTPVIVSSSSYDKNEKISKSVKKANQDKIDDLLAQISQPTTEFYKELVKGKEKTVFPSQRQSLYIVAYMDSTSEYFINKPVFGFKLYALRKGDSKVSIDSIVRSGSAVVGWNNIIDFDLQSCPNELISSIIYLFDAKLPVKKSKCLTRAQYKLITYILSWWINTTGGNLSFYKFRSKDWVDKSLEEDYDVTSLGFTDRFDMIYHISGSTRKYRSNQEIMEPTGTFIVESDDYEEEALK
jgi:hypothetical protein